ncbi:MAG: sugar phosphate isomerase/epimerase [Spirochaetales bacterium]|jgi:D-psicose/D-tagatose/L-ribulose 3-epimerase|nr:sugar phosphate isomerase/epimerase [Spirochaetales bacterium]
MRKIGIYYAFWTNEWDVEFAPFFSKVAQLGFDQLELNGGTLVELSSKRQRELREMAIDNNLTLSYGIGLSPENDVSSLDEKVRQRGIAFMERVIDTIANMGGGMVGGTTYSYWPGSMPLNLTSKEPIWEKSVESLRTLAPYAHERGVVINVEVLNRFEQFLINDSKEALRYIEAVNHPACKILLDTFHMNIEEDSFSEAIKRVGPNLAALHLGETNRKPPGMGRIPWGEIKEALDAINFEGPLVMEPFVMEGGQVGRDIGVWRPILEDPDLDALASEALKFVRSNLC